MISEAPRGPHVLRAVAVATLAFAPASGPVLAQVRLDQPTATLTDDFGSIQTVRELPDGRVLVADPLGKALYVVDIDAGTRTQVGTEGQGPQEYRQPDAVWPLPGDSTLLVDLGNGRLVAMGPTWSSAPPGPSPGRLAAGPSRWCRHAAGRGRTGAAVLPLRGGGLGVRRSPTPGAILRLDRAPGARAETVATFLLQEAVLRAPGAPPSATWDRERAALSRGRVGCRAVTARSSWRAPATTTSSGSRRRGGDPGSPVPFDAVPIGTRRRSSGSPSRPAREEASASRSRWSTATVHELRAGVEAGGEREIDQYEWPARKPAFYADRIPVDRRGRAWVRRQVAADVPPPTTSSTGRETGGDGTLDTGTGSWASAPASCTSSLRRHGPQLPGALRAARDVAASPEVLRQSVGELAGPDGRHGTPDVVLDANHLDLHLVLVHLKPNVGCPGIQVLGASHRARVHEVDAVDGPGPRLVRVPEGQDVAGPGTGSAIFGRRRRPVPPSSTERVQDGGPVDQRHPGAAAMPAQGAQVQPEGEGARGAASSRGWCGPASTRSWRGSPSPAAGPRTGTRSARGSWPPWSHSCPPPRGWPGRGRGPRPHWATAAYPTRSPRW